MSTPGPGGAALAPSGVLLLDKPVGLSSNAALQRVRALLGRPKAGHVGSLDPLATGMLPICIGEATKVAGEIVSGRKCYGFTVALGTKTSTGDREGAPVASAPVPPLERAGVTAVLKRFVGEQLQVPPMYSALKRDGQPLYRLARAGVEVERAARPIRIDALELAGLEGGALHCTVLCGKGTYVRTLAEDIASALGTVGHVSALRRLYVEPFAQHPMHTLEALEALRVAGRALPLMDADHALPELPSIELAAAAARRLRQGQALELEPAQACGRVRLYEQGGRFMGLGELDEWGCLRPRRLFS